VTSVMEPGTVFARYRVESVIGRGGMGVVYRATDLSLERPVALKLVAPEFAGDKRFRERFLKEPRMAASLDHPNVVPIYEAGEHDGQLYLAMRYVEGSDLKTVLEREAKLAPDRAISILTQVASALDAAHRRGLVHRDVKPANVLLDEDGHVYLTDFGITKQLGGASTDTGQMVGTLDYLAPEQIRGETVDARTDCYSLACVLYECLSGTPPFHRATEAETMWAHMQEQPAPLRGYPVLDPMFQHALAKDRDERHRTCAELIEAARDALGLQRPMAEVFARSRLAEHRRAIAVAGAVLLVGAFVTGVVAVTGGGESEAEPLGNGVAQLAPSGGELTGFTGTERIPGNVAVGERAVWTLTEGEETISRIDPETGEITDTFASGGQPGELAVGEGALWAGNVGGSDFVNAIVSVSRIDPNSGEVTRTVKLPGGGGPGVLPTAGLPRIAVGDGAVWAINPDGSVSRIDPDSGRVVARIDFDRQAWTIAAGDEGVWFLSLDAPCAVECVTSIDPRRNRVGKTIEFGAGFLWGIAVGGGAVWATDQSQGLLWRIEPGPEPVTRTIDVGRGVTYVSFGDGAPWVGNYIDGTVSRVDPGTNEVAAKTAVGTPQALAVGEGAAWVSVAGGTIAGKLPTPPCSAVAAGETPDVLIASDFPLTGPGAADVRGIEAAIRSVVEQSGFRAGDYSVGYQSCDVSTPETGGFEFRKCASNANAYAHAEQLVAVVGTFSSYCAEVQIPILNRAPGGPLAMISPTNTGPGLTRGPPIAEARGAPDIYYPTGARNYARSIPREDVQAVADAVLAKDLGLKAVYVVSQTDGDWAKIHGRPFERAAQRLGVTIAGSSDFVSGAENPDDIANAVARSGADGVFLAGPLGEGAERVLQSLRARLGNAVTVMTIDVLPASEWLDTVGRDAHGLYISTTDFPSASRYLTPEGERFARDFGVLNSRASYVMTAAQATEAVLDAIARSDGTRESVLAELLDTRIEDGLYGSFRLDDNGDVQPGRIAIMRVNGKFPPQSFYEGAALDRIVTVPPELAD
jgi:ABC-type branched-subunit amino acid transport system substrate-binding protein/predicted Ser/Thr protein kinase